MGTPAKIKRKLTEAVCREMATMPEGTRIIDTDQRGFFAIRLAEGRVGFRAKADTPLHARTDDQPARTLERSLGKWPDDRIAPQQARLKAAAWVAAIKGGTDPKAKPRPTVAGWTLQQAFDQYIIARERDGCVEGSIRTYRYGFKHVVDLRPKWLKRSVRSIINDVAGLRELHDEIYAEDERMNSADACLKLLGRVARYARGKDTTLPAWNSEAVDLFGTRSRADTGMGLDDLAAWWAGMKKLRSPMRRELGLFMLLTGLRSEDALTASEEHLNETEKKLFVPEPKGGARKSFTLPLSDAALACIYRARALRKNNDVLFPNPETGLPYTDATLGSLPSGHALRHSFETIAEDVGIDGSVVPRLLNHSARSQTMRYGNPDRIVRSPREAMDAISAAIMEKIKL